jgi:ornithine cyclodeaminase/alanine dehydrogenase
MKDTVAACEEAFDGWGRGEVLCPTKITLELGEDAEWPPFKNGLNAMPAYIHSKKIAGIKCVGGSLNNPSWGLPYIIALILLFDPETGVFRCVMDGEQITNYRTGAQSAVAAKYISNKKSINLGIYGAGAQGRTQLLAFSEVFEIKNVAVYDINPAACAKYVEDMSKNVRATITVAKSPEEVTADSDIIVSVTHSRDKFIKNAWIKPGQILFPMGSFTECEDELLLSVNSIFVDSIGQTMHRGSLKSVVDQGKFTEGMITGTIGEIVCGSKSGRMDGHERVICIPIGTGAMDVAVAASVYEKASRLDEGTAFIFNDAVEVTPKR